MTLSRSCASLLRLAHHRERLRLLDETVEQHHRRRLF
jgi:hypothetical protein